MRFVRPASNYNDQNLVLSQQGYSLYYTTTRAILPRQELQVNLQNFINTLSSNNMWKLWFNPRRIFFWGFRDTLVYNRWLFDFVGWLQCCVRCQTQVDCTTANCWGWKYLAVFWVSVAFYKFWWVTETFECTWWE